MDTNLDSWDTDFLSFNSDELLVILDTLQKRLNIPLNSTTSTNFLEALRSKYHELPYHNFTHAVNVAHTGYLLLAHYTKNGTLAIFTRTEQTALWIALLCHDAGHNGRGSGFHRATQSEIAKMVGCESSILERYHTRIALELVNTFSLCDQDIKAEVLKLIPVLIMATDISQYKSIHCTARDILNSGKDWQEDVSSRIVVLSLIMQFCDLSIFFRSWNLVLNWSDRIQEEMFLQVLVFEAKFRAMKRNYMEWKFLNTAIVSLLRKHKQI